MALARLALAPIATVIEGHDQMKPIIDPDIPMEEADEHDIRLAQEIAAEVGGEGRLEHADAMDRVIVQASRYDRATVVNVELLAALKGVLHAYSMGPLDCAALYGPDADLRQIERNATARANDAIEKASIAGVKS